ncbi:alanine--tRNA ligase [Candidatus Amesbacteria bacterium RIFOXYB1_FULL_44_23]|uniref:Alanine--tRNA ligase n=1 Tax=Candidatus Amesbacteria bacterium RIFOXYB1_FULL_44_23 TaxID=1797263 RepID=A0A1F4ZV48_9BACT|nr:MAG: alanine--tRNA ligase [Candidatus Amesbacteria bacterium RIFOXYB1_FULL_44_23]
MSANDIRLKYLNFYKARNHAVIPSAPLVPENDPTVLYTTAGMHPLIPYLLGQPHPAGNRLVNVQKCVRTNDIDEVGDAFHHTFFEMLGHWSLGDYYKKEALAFTFELLTQVFEFDPQSLSVTCFAGDLDAPKDEESSSIWQSLGIPKDRIYFLPKEDNWWGPAGVTGPCGPDSEVFVDLTKKSCGPNCQPGCSCGRFCEVGNDVFMQYNKTSSGKYELLPKPNVDNGTGLERNLALINGFNDNYLTDLWQPAVKLLENITNREYSDNKREFRIVVDHLRAAIFIIADGVFPSNKERGYILRRLIRRAVLKLHLFVPDPLLPSLEVANVFIAQMSPVYPELNSQKDLIKKTLADEVGKFSKTLDRGLREFNKIKKLDGKAAFDLFQTFGFPWEITIEMAKQNKQTLNYQEFETEFKRHQQLSRTASVGMFKGGLQDQSEITTKYHTATHLLHKALRIVLGDHVQQKGSNITSERLRFDFSHSDKLTSLQTQKVEEIVNQKIIDNLTVSRAEQSKSQALSQGALAFFVEKYPDQVSVYTIGPEENWFSKELCGGPHVNSTGEIGGIKIIKEESAGAGIRRIYAQLTK